MRWGASNRRRRASVWLAAALTVALAACEDRERIGTGPDNGNGGTGGDGEGPITTIRAPGVEDTTVIAGPGVFVAGVVTDDTGLDSVYFDVSGGVTRFEPVNEDGSRTLSFALPITTNGQQGQLITVEVYGVDLAGNRGERATRRISVVE
jgi:hypothetical protein